MVVVRRQRRGTTIMIRPGSQQHRGAHLQVSWGDGSEIVSAVEALEVLIRDPGPGDVVLVTASRSAGRYRVVIGQLRNLLTIAPDSAGPVVEPVDTPIGAIPPEEQESR